MEKTRAQRKCEAELEALQCRLQLLLVYEFGRYIRIRQVDGIDLVRRTVGTAACKTEPTTERQRHIMQHWVSMERREPTTKLMSVLYLYHTSTIYLLLFLPQLSTR